jgi:mono/diheme cytochrome c family protein
VKTVLKWLGIVATALVCILLLGAAIVYAVSNRKLAQRYAVGAEWVAPATDSAAVARGRHLAEAVTKCVDCHGADLGGTMFLDITPFARLAAPNITRGRGGRGNAYSDAAFARLLLHGVKSDGRGAVIMPSEAYRYLGSADLAAVIAWVRSMPNVDREWPAPRFGPVFRMLLAFGAAPVIPAAYIDHDRAMTEPPPADTTPAYGRYLTQIGGCSSCHNASYSGGKNAGGPPDSPPAWNLTPTGLAGWTEADFIGVLRQGKRVGGGAPINEHFMPWRSSGRMSDAEIHAVWLFLKTLPPKELGTR